MPDRYSDPEPDEPSEPSPESDAMPDDIWAAEDRARAVVECGLCDDDGYRGNRVCDHVDRSETAQRGMAAIREILSKPKGADA